jgi:hypothetical protein
MNRRRDQEEGAPRDPRSELDELLGLDPEPRLPDVVRQRIHDQLAAENDRMLDAILGLDEVTAPADLGDRVRAAVRADARRRRFRPVGWVAVAAAASLLLAASIGWDPRGRSVESGGEGAVAALDVPSAELLAALPLLESLEFLEQELDPFEQEVALVVDPRDTVLLELVELGG